MYEDKEARYPQFTNHRNTRWTIPTLDEAQTAVETYLSQFAEGTAETYDNPAFPFMVDAQKCYEYECDTQHYHDLEHGIMELIGLVEPSQFDSIM